MGVRENSPYFNQDVEQEDGVHQKKLTPKQHLSLAIGRQIYFTRKMRCITGKQLGELLNVSQQQVSRYERGVCHIDVDALVCQ